MEFGALEFGHLEAQVEVEGRAAGRVPCGDSDPIVLTRLLRLGDDTVPLDHPGLDSFLV